MRKITFILSLLSSIAITMNAEITTGKKYRIKVETERGDKYLDATDKSNLTTGTNGGVCATDLDEENEDQIFIFETSGEGYKLKSKSGYYISCADWNVNAYSQEESSGTVLYFRPTDADGYNYRITNMNGNAQKYFKCEYVAYRYDSDQGKYVGTDKYHPFCDAPLAQAATWTLEEVNDGGTIEPEPEPEPDPTPTPADPTEFYNSIGKPSFNSGGNTSLVAQVVFDDKNITDFTYIKGQVNRVNSVINVEAGKDYSLDITYELNFGCLGIFQIHGSGDNVVAEKKYGYYSCVWRPDNHEPLSLLEENSEKIASELGAAFSDLDKFTSGTNQYLTLPYKITIPENLTPGEFVVVRVMVGRTGNNNTYDEKGIAEGGCLDIVFQVVEPEKPALPITLAQITDQDKLLYGLEGNITTFSAPYATAIPEGVTAYYAEPVEWNGTDVISLEFLKESVVPANFGVILVGNTATVTMEPTDVNVDTPENVFSHSAAGSVELGENCYVLANGKDGKGLYLAKTGLELPANKAYLQLSTPSSTSAFRFVIGETTAIQSVATENAKVSIYDLSGRRVFNTAKGGVYIKNGKKFIVK